MAFEARRDELKQLVQSQYPGLKDLSGGPDAVARTMEEKTVLDAIEKWGASRMARLERLANTVGLGGGAERNWETEAQKLRSEMGSEFADCLRNVKTPTMLGLRIVTGAQLEEDKLCTAIDKAKVVGGAMDAITTYNKELAEKTDALRAKWDDSKRLADSIMREEERVIEEISTLMKQAVDTIAQKNKSRREKVRAWIKAAEDALKILAAGGPLVGLPAPPELPAPTGEANSTWESMAGDLEARKARYESYFRQDHSSLLVMFKGTREDAQDFLKKHDYRGVALEWTSKARSALAEIRSATTTGGQKSDMEALTSRLFTKLDEAEKAAFEKFDKFVSENQTKFFGAFGPELDKALIGSEKWDYAYRKITSINLPGLLQQWIADDQRDWREVEQTKMPESWSNEMRQAFKNSLERLAKTQEEIARNNSPDAVMVWVKTHAGRLADKLR